MYGAKEAQMLDLRHNRTGLGRYDVESIHKEGEGESAVATTLQIYNLRISQRQARRFEAAQKQSHFKHANARLQS